MMHNPVSRVWDGSSESSDKVLLISHPMYRSGREMYNWNKSPHLEKGRMGNTPSSVVHGNLQDSCSSSREGFLVSPPGFHLVLSSRSYTVTHCPSWWHLKLELKCTPSLEAVWFSKLLPICGELKA